MNEYLFRLINGLAGKYPILDSLAVFLAEYLGYILAFLVFLIFWKKHKVIIEAFLAGGIARLILAQIIRWLWPVSRPFVENEVNLLVYHDQTASFPSGHASFFFAVSTVVYGYNKKAGFLFLVGSLLISFSRIFVGIHWPTDILAGAVVGLFSGWLVLKVLKK